MQKVVIVDLGTGNLRSVSKAVSFVAEQTEVCISADTDQIRNAGHLILPGQGAIGTWFNQLNDRPALKDAVTDRLSDGPVLGICLGLQALFESSEENGGVNGLGVFKGRVKHFSTQPSPLGNNHKAAGISQGPLLRKIKIPHMGWNRVSFSNDHPLWAGIENDEWFYFVHSYYAQGDDPQQIMGECEYENTFTAAAGTNNVFATQFHPEKSQHAGLQLLKNFLNWNGVV